MVLLATNISNAEFDKAKATGFADTVIMKPLRASMVAACLQQVGIGKKRQQEKGMPNEASFLENLLCGKTILVVDDNVVNRRVAAGALKKFGAHVECADSGKRALDWLQLPHTFDACFMDIQMPEMDGYVMKQHVLIILENLTTICFLSFYFGMFIIFFVKMILHIPAFFLKLQKSEFPWLFLT